MSDTASRSIKALPVLKECSDRKAACRLHPLDDEDAVDASFRAVVDGRVALTVTALDQRLQIGSQCRVTFPYHLSFYAFQGAVKKTRESDQGPEVHFDLPEIVTTNSLRQVFRVPVNPEMGVALTLRMPDRTVIEGEVLNLSESGVEATLPMHIAELAIETAIKLELRFRGDSVELPAVVKRHEHFRVAMQFSLARTPESRQSLTALHRIVRSLEQIWLKNRLG